ncbi:hypothetical protein BKA56DRAFT_605883 [Ilyonectria sp. MPI-CAGE-AT-0026]|nr:hypothetical protein BKA56DRAFT_605883 [Ilyonectria sp. MPI-CAGE-AT-0026]
MELTKPPLLSSVAGLMTSNCFSALGVTKAPLIKRRFSIGMLLSTLIRLNNQEEYGADISGTIQQLLSGCSDRCPA